MTRQQERAWQKRIDNASDAVLQASIAWAQNSCLDHEERLRKVVKLYLDARAGK